MPEPRLQSSDADPIEPTEIVNAIDHPATYPAGRPEGNVLQPLNRDMLERYRSWLGFLARMQTQVYRPGRFSESDIVQQTMFEACRDLPQFRGKTEPELMAWLKKILAHVLAHRARHDRADKRDAGREISLEAAIEASSLRLAGMLADSGPSPSAIAMAREGEVRLADLLEKLPDDYREVIFLRNIEGLPHEEIATRLNRGVGAVRMLWIRALAKMKELLEAEGLKKEL